MNDVGAKIAVAVDRHEDEYLLADKAVAALIISKNIGANNQGDEGNGVSEWSASLLNEHRVTGWAQSWIQRLNKGDFENQVLGLVRTHAACLDWVCRECDVRPSPELFSLSELVADRLSDLDCGLSEDLEELVNFFEWENLPCRNVSEDELENWPFYRLTHVILICTRYLAASWPPDCDDLCKRVWGVLMRGVSAKSEQVDIDVVLECLSILAWSKKSGVCLTEQAQSALIGDVVVNEEFFGNSLRFFCRSNDHLSGHRLVNLLILWSLHHGSAMSSATHSSAAGSHACTHRWF